MRWLHEMEFILQFATERILKHTEICSRIVFVSLKIVLSICGFIVKIGKLLAKCFGFFFIYFQSIVSWHFKSSDAAHKHTHTRMCQLLTMDLCVTQKEHSYRCRICTSKIRNHDCVQFNKHTNYTLELFSSEKETAHSTQIYTKNTSWQ